MNTWAAWLLTVGFFFGASRSDSPQKLKLHPQGTLPANTGCASCHNTSGWDDVRFDHSKTGFELEGAHQGLRCGGCHVGNFRRTLPRTCGGCHRDPHAGELGGYCQGCHDQKHWQGAFTAEAHRRTNFPLVGRHALLPCESCHAEAASRRFSRSAAECVTCHERDYDRTSLLTLNHARFGFSSQCRMCHNPVRFQPALFPGHDACFPISTGDHRKLACASCHSGFTNVSMGGTCSTRTATCTNCHTHSCAVTDALHVKKNVAGYRCNDVSCQACHPKGLRP